LRDKPKVIGLRRIAGKKLMIWGQAPGAVEEFHKKELVGPSGRMLWQEFAAFGVTRDMCDLQNICRCRPTQIIKTQWGERKTIDRAPDKQEIHCCSIYTEKALELQGGKALVHVVLGRVAAKALLRGEYRKSISSFFSKKLKSHVICVYHPSYFLRGGNRTKLKEFRAGLRAAAQIALGTGERYEYVRSMDYKIVRPRDLPELYKEISEAAKTKIISVDIEDGFIPPDTDRKVLVCIGFSWKPGMARIVPYYHSELSRWTPTVYAYIKKFYDAVMGNPNIRKSFHHGSYDVLKSKSLADIDTQGYFWDTNYSEFITNPGDHAYGIGAIADRRYPEMSGYLHVLDPYIPEDREYPNFYEVPLDVLRLYNGADCDISKRIQLSTRKVTPQLMRVYINCGFVIDAMENNGPLFDFEHHKFVESWLPKKIDALLAEIRFMVGEPGFKITPAEVKRALYTKLRLEKHFPAEWIEQNKKKNNGKLKLNTKKETLELLSAYHKLPKKIIEYRGLSKKKSTWLVGFKNSAEMHGGRVRTIWWTTGTVTGRLRSGGKKKLDDTAATGIVNLQNIAGDPTIENLMVSDLNWREVAEKGRRGIIDLDSIVYLALDQGQLEMRVLGQLSRDPLLIQHFQRGEDVHSAVGHELTGISTEKIKADRSWRTAIKGLHFGIVFGLSPDALYDHIVAVFSEMGEKCPFDRKQIAELHAAYFRKYKGVKAYMDNQMHIAETVGRVSGLFGLESDVSASGDTQRGTFYLNQARNRPIQTTAHQLILIALSEYRVNPVRYEVLKSLHMEIHDSLWFSMKLRHLQHAFKVGQYLLTKEPLEAIKRYWKGIDWRVPLVVDGKAGYRLGVVPEYKGEAPAEFMKLWVEKNAEVEAKTLADAKI
jgi:uracil-DNA glycosylase family 4